MHIPSISQIFAPGTKSNWNLETELRSIYQVFTHLTPPNASILSLDRKNFPKKTYEVDSRFVRIFFSFFYRAIYCKFLVKVYLERRFFEHFLLRNSKDFYNEEKFPSARFCARYNNKNSLFLLLDEF